MLAYFFPPVGGGGTQRSGKFAKYLPSCGWLPMVISTSASIGGEGQDGSLNTDLPAEVRVLRPGSWRPQPLTALERRIPIVARARASRQPIVSVLARAVTWPLSVVEHPPLDIFFWWSLAAIPLGWQALRRHGAEVIYTTSSPFSVLLTGWVLRALSGRPWVADFRDPWNGNALMGYPLPGWRGRVQRRMEAVALAGCDHLVLAAPFEPLLRPGARGLAPSTIIWNGYDQEDFELPAPPAVPRLDCPATLLFAGSVYSGTVEPVLAALSQAPPSELAGRLRIDVVGEFGPLVDALAAVSVDPAIFCLESRVPHAEIVVRLRAASALLLLLPDNEQGRYSATGKIYEYLASGTPILAVVPANGVAADLIRRTGTGVVVDPADVAGLAAVILELASDPAGFRARHYRPVADQIAVFDRRALTAQLAAVFDAVAPAATMPATEGS